MTNWKKKKIAKKNATILVFTIDGISLRPDLSSPAGCYFISRKIIDLIFFANIGQFMNTPFDQKSQ